MLAHTSRPMCRASCRSRPGCPFRCNLICTPIILCFSGGCVSRALSQHADVLSPSICHWFSLTLASSPCLSLSHVCPTSHMHTCPVSIPTSPPPPLCGPTSHQGAWFLSLSSSPFLEILYTGVELCFPAWVIDTDLVCLFLPFNDRPVHTDRTMCSFTQHFCPSAYLITFTFISLFY